MYTLHFKKQPTYENLKNQKKVDGKTPGEFDSSQDGSHQPGPMPRDAPYGNKDYVFSQDSESADLSSSSNHHKLG